MEIKDIKSGYVVVTRGGERLIVTRTNQDYFTKCFGNRDGYVYADCYDENLCHNGTKVFDIVKVYGLSNDPGRALCITDLSTRPLLWERPKPKKLTFEQIEKLLGYPIEIVSEANNE